MFKCTQAVIMRKWEKGSIGVGFWKFSFKGLSTRSEKSATMPTLASDTFPCTRTKSINTRILQNLLSLLRQQKERLGIPTLFNICLPTLFLNWAKYLTQTYTFIFIQKRKCKYVQILVRVPCYIEPCVSIFLKQSETKQVHISSGKWKSWMLTPCFGR
jgi:hypothetical protein